MFRDRQPLRGARVAALLFATFAVLLASGQQPAYSNDIDLLRFDTAKPYVFFILDTSASMNASPSGQFVHANGDDPRSKIYQAKRVLYDVLKDVDDIQFGFASMNQDKSGVVAKHWLYYNKTALPAAGAWPINYPRPDADGPVQIQANGTVVDDVEGDLMTFGPHLVPGGVAGTCAAPLLLTTDLEKINRFAKLGTYGNETTRIWVKSGNTTYRLSVDRPGNKPDTSPNSKLGQNGMNVKLTLERVSNCTGPVFNQTSNLNLDLELWTDFIMVDEPNGTSASGSKASGVDNVPGWWDYKGIRDTATCGSGHPFSGKGWEGNYDGESFPPVPGGLAASMKPTEDPYCTGANCYNLRRPTTFSTAGRPLDSGDMIPLHWSSDNKDLFLDRLSPGHLTGGDANFKIASFFKDPDAAAVSPAGILELRNESQIPLFASGPTPLGKAVIDFRCWYLGEGNKCNESAYNPGWETIAQQNDSAWGCRRPYMIVISDGNDSCPGENPCADTANLNSRGAIRTWVVAFGANCNSTGNPLKCMAQNGKGELLCPATANDLKTELQRILGLIREETRAFASAAVPSVQAIVDDKIFLTNFTPLNGEAVWDGHVHSFLKPLPLNDLDKRPDLEHENHLWDGGEVLKTQVNSADPLGANANQRRVYYSRDTASGNLTGTRRLLEPTQGGVTANSIRYDLWRGFGVGFFPGIVLSEAVAELRVNNIIAKTFAMKEAETQDADGNTQTIQYILGDIFHSNPLVIGSPPNSLYFTQDIDGYRDFFLKHELRRKLLLVGSNDGMLHAFDAGTYNSSTKKFTNGTGKEVFAYMPRAVMPAVKLMAEGTTHQWGVDGTVTVADVHIDPKHDGDPDEDEREWRTVGIGGLREGGSGYYALDLTQPDRLQTVGGVENVPQSAGGGLPSCSGGDNGIVNVSDCGPIPFPAALWEFNDSVRNAAGNVVRLDEEDLDNNGTQEGNSLPDLGYTWSVPNIGRIRITEGGDTVAKYVAIFGGGFDPNNKTAPQRGTFLYMVDIETGRTLYKRRLRGAIPSEPAAVDTNQDGFIDRIYVGTTAGQMYRVDLGTDASGAYPALASKNVRGEDGILYNRYFNGGDEILRIPDNVWVPRIIFNANTDAGTPLVTERPIFFRPSVIFVAKLGRYALSFGVGDRDDLWSKSLQTGRFYVFVDDSDDLPGVTFNESNFQRITSTTLATSAEYLFNPAVGRRGWYMVLQPEEKVVTDAFALSGVTAFSTFIPDVEVTGGRDPLCSKTGISRVFVVGTINGNPFMIDDPDGDGTGDKIREKEVPTLVTNPFTEQGQTKNENAAVEICDEPAMMTLMNSLKSLFPRNCKFSNYRVDIKTIASDTGLVCIAPVPVCIVEKNWKEF